MSLPLSRAQLLKFVLPLICLGILAVIGYRAVQVEEVSRVEAVQPAAVQSVARAQIQEPSPSPAPEAEAPPEPAPASQPAGAAEKTVESAPEHDHAPSETGEQVYEETLYARIQEILRLRKEPSPEAVDRLAQSLTDPSRTLVVEAIDTLGFLALEDGSLRDSVWKILKEKALSEAFPEQGHALVTAATVGGEESLPVIREYLSGEGDGKARFAVRALALVNSPDSVPLLESLLQTNEDPEMRRLCFDVLARIDTPETVALLEAHAAASSGAEQAASVAALSRLDRPETNRMLADLVRRGRLDDPARQALAVSPASPEIYEDLLSGGDLRLPQKVDLLKEIRSTSLYAPGETRSDMVSVLVPFLDHPDAAVQMEALKAVSQLGGGEEYTADLLLPKLKSANPEVRQTALASFLGYANPWNYKEVSDLIFDSDEQTRRMALFAFERFVNQSDVEVLRRAADSEDEFISERAEMILEQLNPA
jgi:HEAT repeat protein